MVSPSDTTSVTRPGSRAPISKGRQPTPRRRALAPVTATISHSATAASARRSATNSATAISATANLVAGVAEDHRQTAASIARLASAEGGRITRGGRGGNREAKRRGGGGEGP